LCLAHFISYIILQIISDSFGNFEFVGKKSYRDAKKKNESSISKWQRIFFSNRREGSLAGTPDISLCVDLLMRKNM